MKRYYIRMRKGERVSDNAWKYFNQTLVAICNSINDTNPSNLEYCALSYSY